jgi:hypothetical protein
MIQFSGSSCSLISMPGRYRGDTHSSLAFITQLVDSLFGLLPCSSKMSPYTYDGYSRQSYGRSHTGVWDSLFDRLSSDRRRHAGSSHTYRCPPTYGTYYAYSDQPSPSRTSRRSPSPSTRTADSSVCACTCCPHECWKHQVKRKNRSREGADRRRDRGSSPAPSSARRQPRDHDSRERNGPRESRSDAHRHPSNKPYKAPDTTTNTTTTIIRVHDHTNGPLWRRHGADFPLTIPADVTARDILFSLSPTGSEKVVVVWAGGGRQTLAQDQSVRELRKHAVGLEIRRKKQVHWR